MKTLSGNACNRSLRIEASTCIGWSQRSTKIGMAVTYRQPSVFLCSASFGIERTKREGAWLHNMSYVTRNLRSDSDASASGLNLNRRKGTGRSQLAQSTTAVVSRGDYVQENPERQAIRQFLDFMRIGDTESAYQTVEKMKFSDFVDALEAVQREKTAVSKRSAADRSSACKRAREVYYNEDSKISYRPHLHPR